MKPNSCTKLLLIASATIVISPPAHSQQFEVASIKPSDPNGHGVRIEMAPGGRFTASGVTVKFLIQQAYDIKDFQITAGPGWMGSEKYDITAKAEGEGGDMTPERLRPMMQALLADRFQLKFHRDDKEMPVYALVVGKNGPKMHASERVPEGDDRRGGTQVRISRGQITAQGMSMSMLANQLSNRLGRNVLDKTGLPGNYDFTLEFTPEGMQPMGGREPGVEAAPPLDSPGPSLFTAVQEQLGLKLESQKGPVSLFIIDQIQKASEN